MLITSSRKPSNRTRTLCKQLATFFNCDYINRGKMGMGEVLDLVHDNSLLIAGEFHGNPGSLAIYNDNGHCLISIHITVADPESLKFKKLKRIEPVIVGHDELANAMANHLSLQLMDDPLNSRCAVINDGIIDFIDSGKLLFKIKVKSLKLDFLE